MDYQSLTEWMFGLERFGIKLGLENTAEFLGRVGNPHRDFRSVHVTGTNGKGSVCAFIAEILRRHGLKVGLYTSPHLVDFRERIRINGREISESDVVRLGTELRTTMESMASESKEKQLTFFEFTTALAFEYFSEKQVDMVVAEVGLGGRLDATNVLTPDVGVITRIGLEHTKYLGDTISSIAREKAGIVKEGIRMVTCETHPDALSVILGTCNKKGASVRRIGESFHIDNVRQSLNGTGFDYTGKRNLSQVRTQLIGAYQAENAAAAIAAVEELADRGILVSDEEIRKGLRATRWPGRIQIVSRKPLVIFDGSHNPDGASVTARILKDLGATPIDLVIGCMRDKDVRGIVKALAPIASRIHVTQVKNERSLPAAELERIVKAEFSGPVKAFEGSHQALEEAASNIDGKGLCVIGSLYLVGEAIQWWKTRVRSGPGPPHKV